MFVMRRNDIAKVHSFLRLSPRSFVNTFCETSLAWFIYKQRRKQLGNIIKADRNVSAVKSEIFTSDGVLKWNKNRDGW